MSRHEFQQAIKRLEALICDIEHAFDIGITIHDCYGMLSDSKGRSLLANRNLHPHTICQRHERNAYGQAKCVQYCLEEINREAEKQRRPFISNCWKGVSEVVVPVNSKHKLSLVLFAGPFKSGKTAPEDSLLTRKIIREWDSLPQLHPEKRQTLERILTTFGKGLLAEAEELLGVDETTDSRKAVIKRYVYQNAHEQASLEELAQSLYLSKSRTGHLVKELFECTFKELLNNERLNRAKALLSGSQLKAGTIAERCGIPNTHYFSRIFKEKTGKTPIEWRKEKQPSDA